MDMRTARVDGEVWKQVDKQKKGRDCQQPDCRSYDLLTSYTV